MLPPVVCPCLQENMRRSLLCKEIVCNLYKIICAKTILFENSFGNHFGRGGIHAHWQPLLLGSMMAQLLLWWLTLWSSSLWYLQESLRHRTPLGRKSYIPTLVGMGPTKVVLERAKSQPMLVVSSRLQWEPKSSNGVGALGSGGSSAATCLLRKAWLCCFPHCNGHGVAFGHLHG